MIESYLKILHPSIPNWLEKYLTVPCLQRLKHVGLFCGVDYSCLFQPHVFYSRYDHSLGVALIIWHFTQNKEATLAGLFHDVSTPVFSHAIDFKNKDYLTQESTELDNDRMILEDKQLLSLLNQDQIAVKDILHYSDYPVADLKAPALCADRLEYMFSTGYFLCDYFNLDLIKQCYENITIQDNGELGFNDINIAKAFFNASIKVTLLFLEPYDKITLQLLASLVEEAIKHNLFKTSDLYIKTEQEIIHILSNSSISEIRKYYQLLTKQTKVISSPTIIENAFCMKIDVKRRYVNPLVNNIRLSTLDSCVQKKIDDLFIIDPNYICLSYWCA